MNELITNPAVQEFIRSCAEKNHAEAVVSYWGMGILSFFILSIVVVVAYLIWDYC